MPMYNLIEYSSNYSETTGGLWLYSKDKGANITNANNFKSFKYKAKFLQKTEDQPTQIIPMEFWKNEVIAAPLKYWSNFWRSLDMPLINCKVELKLKWTKYGVLSAAGADNTDTDSNNINLL